MINKNFLIGLGVTFALIILGLTILAIGFLTMGPAFIFVLFIVGVISSIVAINYDEIEWLGETISEYMKGRE